MRTAKQWYDQAMQEMATKLLLRKTSRTYKNEYVRFCKWVKDNLPPEEQVNGLYITRSNIYRFFLCMLSIVTA
jgi:hypothetical protein